MPKNQVSITYEDLLNTYLPIFPLFSLFPLSHNREVIGHYRSRI